MVIRGSFINGSRTARETWTTMLNPEALDKGFVPWEPQEPQEKPVKRRRFQKPKPEIDHDLVRKQRIEDALAIGVNA